MSSERAHASPKHSGDTIEHLVVNRNPLRHVSDRDASWHDAATVDVIAPSRRLRMGGVCLLEADTPVEIKAAQGLVSNGDHNVPGRWMVKRDAHERLLAADGAYWLVVYKPAGRDTDLLGQIVISASLLDEHLDGRWFDGPAHRSEDEIAKLGWPHLLDRAEGLER